MELNKYVIRSKYHSQTIYYPKSEVLDQKNYELLGFKDCIPVVCTKMSDAKNSAGVKKTLKIEVNPKTGEKYINLNGKKIKIIPESELPTQLPKNAQVRKIASLNSIPAGSVKLKVLRGVPLKNSNFSITRYTNKDNHASSEKGNQTVSEIPKLNCLSPKTLIKESELNVKSLSSNMTIKANTADNKSHQNSDMFESESKSVVKTYKSGFNKSNENVIALDLTNYSVKLNQSGGVQNDNFTQTEDKKFVDASMQTDDFNLLNYDLDEIMQDLTPLLQPTPRSSETFDNFNPSIDLLDLDSKPTNLKPISELNHHSEASNFFTELRMALQPDEKGNMRIHMAVLQNDPNMIKRSWFILKTLNQSVDLPNSNDFTALQLAIINDASKEIIKFLISKQASLRVTDSDGNNVIHLAIEYHRVDALPILLDQAFKTRFNLDQYNHEGLTPLIMCCLNGLHQCAKLLLDFQADINARDLISGRTALFHAAECHDVDMVQWLLQYQADTKIKNFFGTSPHDAMYEIDDVPEQIKCMILGKNNKRKTIEDPRALKVTREEFKKSKSSLKTYARLQKIDSAELVDKFLTSVK